MSAASCASGDFAPDLRVFVRAAQALLGQARDAMHGMSGPGQEREERTEASFRLATVRSQPTLPSWPYLGSIRVATPPHGRLTSQRAYNFRVPDFRT